MGARYTAQQFISVMPGSAGIVTTIARRVGCTWHTARKYIDRHPTIKAAYDAECEKVLDAAESVVIGEIVEDKDVQTAKWYLTMKGSGRGYAQKQRVDVTSDDKPIQPNVIVVREVVSDDDG